MKINHLPIIHLVDMIPGKDEDEIWPLLLDRVDILENGIRGPLIPMFIDSLLSRNGFYEFSQRGRKNVPSKLDVTMKGGRFILGEGIDTANIRIDAIRKGEVDNPINGTEGNSWVAPVPGKGIKPLTPPACQHHR